MKSKTKLNTFLILCLTIILCFAGVDLVGNVARAENADFTGQGSEESPYLIQEVDDLKTLSNEVNGGINYKGKYFKLTNDIDLNGEEWTPIGNKTNKFCGYFDGNQKTISNLKITGNSSDVGLFGFTTDGEIKNLTVNNANVSGYLNIGVVAGTPYTSKYTNINVSGHIEVNGFAYVGGVGGKNAYANWTNVTVNVDQTSYVFADSISGDTAYRTYVGGVIGFIGEGGHSFKDVSSNVKVEGTVCDIGGIAGIAHYGNVFENVIFTGSVIAPEGADEVGGVAGVWHNQAGKTVTFKNCQSTGSVTIGNQTITGSIVGGAYHSNNETYDNSGSLLIDGKEAWIKSCKINDVGYVTLEEAIANSEFGDEIILLKDIDDTITIAGVKLITNGYSAPNVTVEELKISEITVARNPEDNATVLTITYLNSEKVTTVVIPDGKDGTNGTNGTDGINGKDGVNGIDANNIFATVGMVTGITSFIVCLIFVVVFKNKR